MPFRPWAMERTSGWTVPLAMGRQLRSTPSAPPSMEAMYWATPRLAVSWV